MLRHADIKSILNHQSKILPRKYQNKFSFWQCFKSGVIYKFLCQECNSCYVGGTHKHFNTRRNEHLETEKLSSVNKNLQMRENCKMKNDENSFSILDYSKTDYELSLKEAMHIKWENPSLNGQKIHAIIR